MATCANGARPKQETVLLHGHRGPLQNPSRLPRRGVRAALHSGRAAQGAGPSFSAAWRSAQRLRLVSGLLFRPKKSMAVAAPKVKYLQRSRKQRGGEQTNHCLQTAAAPAAPCRQAKPLNRGQAAAAILAP